MSQKIRIGNDIDIRWSLLDEESHPYVLEGRTFSIEVVINDKKRVRIKDVEVVDGNVAHFVYYGKDQKYTGRCDLKYTENENEVPMVTFDTKDAFTMVEHSWLALDEGETPETIQLEIVAIQSNLLERVGPPGPQGPVGPAAGFGVVDAEADDGTGDTPSVDVETSGPDTAKNIHFAFHDIRGPMGPPGGVYWPEIMVDNDLWIHIIEPTPQLGLRLYVTDGVLYAID